MATAFSPDRNSLGFRIGRAIGWTGAQAVQRTEQAVEATGSFGRNVVAGTREGYRITSDDVKRARAAKLLGVPVEALPKAEPAPVAAPATQAVPA